MTPETDLKSLAAITSQVCVVGSGPVGACLALDLVDRGLSVTVLESGLKTPNSKAQSLSDAIIENPLRHADMSIATCRALGGTSWLWGGRCTELQEIDLVARDYVPNSGWPISYRDVAEFYPRAAELLGIGTGVFRHPEEIRYGDVQLNEVEIWANETRIHKRLKAFNKFNRIKFVLDATVVDLEIDSGSRSIAGLVVANGSQRAVFRGATYYVLALGGVETTRLLLDVQTRHPELFGGWGKGPLGRYYMGHVSGSVADIKFSSPLTARQFQFEDHPSSASRMRFTLLAAAQKRLNLPNIAFWPDNPPLADANHRSGFLSASYLVLSLPGLGSSFIPEAIRRNELRGRSNYAAHLNNCISDFSGLIHGGVDFVKQRFYQQRRLPRWFDVTKGSTYHLHYHAEHRPRAENHIRLSDAVDPLGMRRAAIHFDFGSDDIDGVYRAHEILNRSLRAASVGELIIRIPRDDFLSNSTACSPDGLHQIGTTRMAMNPADGVVDPECRVFDLQNLFIAGSSVFCTAGQANPTFPAVALAIRLAAHLDRNIKQLDRSPGTAQIPAHLKILHVLPSIDAASGGPSRAVFDLALAARHRGHAVTICATNYGGPGVEHAECLKAGVKVVVFPVFGPGGLQYSPGMQSYLRENLGSFDIVHLHSLYLPHDWMVHRYAVQYHVPYILRPHGTFDPVVRNRKRLRKWALDKVLQDRVNEGAAGIHYTSDDERSLSNCTKDQSWVIPLPIRMEEFHGQDWDADFKSRHGIRGEYILFLGRLAWKKGADILIRAFAEFLARQPDVELVIAGPDFGEVDKLQHLAQKLGIDSHVHFTGMLNGPARVAAYRLAKVFAVPSRGENFGRTVTEAMVVGTPIVMTDRIGIWKEVVREDVALVVEADVKSVCRGLWAAWDAYPDAIARAVRATEFVISHFGLDTVGETLERMYFDALAVTRKEQQASPFGIGPS